jgi:hypothetical protein
MTGMSDYKGAIRATSRQIYSTETNALMTRVFIHVLSFFCYRLGLSADAIHMRTFSCVRCDFPAQPRTGVGPEPLGCASGMPSAAADSSIVMPAKYATSRGSPPSHRQLPAVQGFIDGQQLLGRRALDKLGFVQLLAFGASAALETPLAAGRFDEDAAHGLRRDRKKVSTPFELRIPVPGQPEPSLVDEGGGLERVTGCLLRHFVGGDPAQFVVYQRQQLVGRLGIASLNRLENARHITHSENSSKIDGEIHRTFGVSRPLSAKSIFGGLCFRLAHGWVKAKNDRIHPEVKKGCSGIEDSIETNDSPKQL